MLENNWAYFKPDLFDNIIPHRQQELLNNHKKLLDELFFMKTIVSKFKITPLLKSNAA